MKLGLLNVNLLPKSARTGSPEMVTPTIPALENVIRAFSIRRIVPSYGLGPAVEVPGVINYGYCGRIVISGLTEKYLSKLYEQKGGLTISSLYDQLVPPDPPKIYDGLAVYSGIYFDGTNLIKMAANPDGTPIDTALETGMIGDCSYSVFLNTLNTSNGKIPFSRHGNDSGRFQLTLRSGGVFRAEVGNTTTYMTSPALPYNNGNWHMITVTKSATGGTSRLYFNGIEVVTLPNTPAPTTGSKNTLAVGGAGTTPLYTGYVNDLIFWDKQLSEAEVVELYNQLKPFYPSSGAK